MPDDEETGKYDPEKRNGPRSGGVERGPTSVRHAGSSRRKVGATGGKSRSRHRDYPRIYILLNLS